MKLFRIIFSLLLLILLMVSCTEDDSSTNPHSDFQTFARNYGTPFNNVGYGILKTDDGGFYLGGYADVDGNENYDVIIVKTNSQGDTLWQKYYGGNENDYCFNLLDDGNGNIVFGGNSRSDENADNVSYLTKIDSEGNPIWTAYQIPDRPTYPRNLIKTNDGGYALFGQSISLDGDEVNSILIKTDCEGNEEWFQTYPSQLFAFGFGFCQADNEDFILYTYRKIVGEYDSTYVDGLFRTNEIGDIIWEYRFGHTRPIISCFSIINSSDGGFVFTGLSENIETYDMIPFVAKLDENGNEVWYNDFPLLSEGYGIDLIETNDNGYLITGCGFTEQIILLKINSSGEMIWWHEYSDKFTGGGTSLIETLDGGYAIYGNTYSYSNAKLFFLKTDHDGWVY